MDEKYFYATQRDEEDDDWGFGSYDLLEACEMIKPYLDDGGRIAKIKMGEDPVCVEIYDADDVLDILER